MSFPHQPPTPEQRLAVRLQTLFQQQGRDVLAHLSADMLFGDRPPPDLSHWDVPLAEATRHDVLASWQHGEAEMGRLLVNAGHRPPARVMARPGSPFVHAKAIRRRTPLARIMHVDARTAQAIGDMTLEFCAEANATATREIGDTLARLRQALKDGVVDRGEAVWQLNRRVARLFGDPKRAKMIAATEYQRAIHAGQMQTARDNKVWGMRWVNNGPDVCDICRRLHGLEKELDKPFITLRGVRDPYRIVKHPPAHPWCRCSQVPVLQKPKRR